MPTLNGSLDTFSLPDVLRLIASTGKSGLLWIESGEVNGRVYFRGGAITYASTRDLRVDSLGPEERRIVDVDRVSYDQSAELLQQQLTDVMVRLLGSDAGTFSFEEGTVPPHEVRIEFEVETVLKASTDRIEEWRRIGEVLPSVGAKVRLVKDLEGDEVTLDPRSWSVVATLGSRPSAAEVAQELKVFEFAAAKKVAELIRRGLVEVVPEAPSQWADLVAPRVAVSEDAEIELADEAPAEEDFEEPEEADDEPVEQEERLAVGELAKRWRELSSARHRSET